MNDEFIQQLFESHKECVQCPSREEVQNFFEGLLGTLFPNYSKVDHQNLEAFNLHLLNLKEELYELLYTQSKTTGFDAWEITRSFFDAIPQIYADLHQDVTAMYKGDPAAVSEDEVIRSYPGFYAIAAYRLAHQLAKSGVQIIPRMITELAHNITGIDIHPNAKIGSHFCIDHGTGIVIGETTIIGNHVKIYQGVTLGALSVKKEDAKTKRHPTIEDHVVIYSNATILGGETVIGKNSTVGGNVWITKSIPPNSTVHYSTRVSAEGENAFETNIIKTQS